MADVADILVPTDLSPAAEPAEQFAFQLASGLHATLHMLHVIADPLAMGWGADEARLPRVLDEADEAVRARIAQLRAIQTGEVETRVAVDTGPPEDRIVKYADTKGIDLIVMAPHGRGAVEKVLMGSVTDAVLRHAHCPVTVVPPRT